ncbi:nucleoside diphosphate-linked moiety X motif 17-like isoform X1 [Mytilus californianus]|uniref:nucleoside diphosphate-linked moiety X motif 17-like isoform X1 n=1 Tax=Mytilus californianus TaxID=6549 RepID=UPI0022461F19|nr:nucleoside diphosphate-linked moiety X motif 17-like isoform X1 [Mytilus californianus]XP_052098562.1 nucleoside diphosphate-linked moiety X motif 17-like isoform X1 [Mytilus californianus]XP_052098563.1 nucleoside diphosphate-linked moiety X motif 17-like isoform X1 [Mytilus californianus]XP_052098564.1 nucleoside diphosphate-linked moiety X motif 17-like isoform X1 [Mytilus californianus]
MASSKRILVHVQRKGIDNKPFIARFTQCIVDYFENDKTKLTTHLCPLLVNNQLIITDQSDTIPPVKMKHPSFCPIRNLCPLEDSRLPDDTKHRGIDVGAAVILESADGKILLTRRSKALRTFPGVWVPPGGHIEENETLIEAGLRELEEETGLHILPSQCVDQQVHVLSLWESVFPTKLSLGQPKRHHVVLYLHAKLIANLTSEKLNQQMKLCPKEVGACAWLEVPVVEAIVSGCEETAKNPTVGSHITKKIKGFIINEKEMQEEAMLPTLPLMTVAGDFSDSERVSTGTKFALEEWLAKSKL